MLNTLAKAVRSLDTDPALAALAARSPTYEVLRTKARKLPLGGKTLYVLEGDLLLDDVQLARYALRKDTGGDEPVAEAPVGGERARLLGISKNGRLLRWKPSVLLGFYVARETFPSDDAYRIVRENIRTAAEDWMNVCGVEFAYLPALDDDASVRPGGALFSVVYQDVGGRLIAAAFFPDDPPDRRFVIVDPSYLAPGLRFDRVGVFRHELGHVLGFRHEQIRSEAPAACPGEPLFGTTPLTDYDPQSVMHYFCGGVGSEDLEITELDRMGAQRLYGLPRSAFEFAE